MCGCFSKKLMSAKFQFFFAPDTNMSPMRVANCAMEKRLMKSYETFEDLFEVIEPEPSFGDSNLNAEALERAVINFHSKIGYKNPVEPISPIRSIAAAITALAPDRIFKRENFYGNDK